MKVILEEYGKVFICSLIGIIVVGAVAIGIRSWYVESYPTLQQASELSIYTITESPVLLAEPIEVRMEDIVGEIDFAEYAVGYENNELEMEIPVTVIGTELVDLDTKGIYQIVFQVTDSKGETFNKKVPVLIY